MASTTRPSLLSRLRDPRDAEAWQEFDVAYRDLIRRYCARSGLQVSDTEDVCQLVLLALVRSLPRFHFDPGRGRFRNYLGRIVKNCIFQQRARQEDAARSLEDCVEATLASASDDPVEAGWDEEWSNHHLRRAMRAVRASCKPASLVIFERLLRGQSVETVADSCRTTPEAVYKVKQRIGERLKLEIQRQIREEELQS